MREFARPRRTEGAMSRKLSRTEEKSLARMIEGLDALDLDLEIIKRTRDIVPGGWGIATRTGGGSGVRGGASLRRPPLAVWQWWVAPILRLLAIADRDRRRRLTSGHPITENYE
jgi:hypothetical protein